jgi:hypothetical protein
MAYSDKVIDHYNNRAMLALYQRKTRMWVPVW